MQVKIPPSFQETRWQSRLKPERKNKEWKSSVFGYISFPFSNNFSFPVSYVDIDFLLFSGFR